MNDQNEHDFVFPEFGDMIGVMEGFWEEFCNNPQRLAQLERNQISYGWDALIEKFVGHSLAGTSHHASGSVAHMEFAYRFLARENRTRRRYLMEMFRGLKARTQPNARGVRIIHPSSTGDPYYVFMLLPCFEGVTEEEYRLARRNHLEQYCMVVKAKWPDARFVVGIAINSDWTHGVSEDLICLDVREWTEEQQEEALRLQRELNMLNDVRMFAGRITEYPDVSRQPRQRRPYTPSKSATNTKKSKTYPNEKCPCGSEVKFKRCCGKP